MQDTSNIVSEMIIQHRLLQDDLGKIILLLNSSDFESKVIFRLLAVFSKDLDGHLLLENKTFYPMLLDKMKQSGREIKKTEEFIAQMDKIGERIMAFLDKYDSATDIATRIDEFRVDLDLLVEILNVRIEVEESGVYLYWE